MALRSYLIVPGEAAFIDALLDGIGRVAVNGGDQYGFVEAIGLGALQHQHRRLNGEWKRRHQPSDLRRSEALLRATCKRDRRQERNGALHHLRTMEMSEGTTVGNGSYVRWRWGQHALIEGTNIRQKRAAAAADELQRLVAQRRQHEVWRFVLIEQLVLMALHETVDGAGARPARPTLPLLTLRVRTPNHRRCVSMDNVMESSKKRKILI